MLFSGADAKKKQQRARAKRKRQQRQAKEPPPPPDEQQHGEWVSPGGGSRKKNGGGGVKTAEPESSSKGSVAAAAETKKKPRRHESDKETSTATTGTTKRDDSSKEKDDADLDEKKKAGDTHRKKRPWVSETATRPWKQARGPPLAAALALSEQLKELSVRKLLSEALELYWDPMHDDIRDGHHASILVDCSSRCGNIEMGESIVESLKEAGMVVPIQAKTALLKGYSHVGRIQDGMQLFRDMCLCKDKRQRPNVRTLNTLLRGCLWTAATTVTTTGRTTTTETTDSDNATVLVGGVATSQEAWKLLSSSRRNFDASSYEYSTTLLCQALLCREAQERLQEFVTQNDSSSEEAAETVAVMQVALARAHALLGNVQQARNHAKDAIQVMETKATSVSNPSCSSSSSSSLSLSIHGTKERRGASGGKRAWKRRVPPQEEGRGERHPDGGGRREESNTLYRHFRWSELRNEAQRILHVLSHHTTTTALPSRQCLAAHLSTKLLYFAGGASTPLSTTTLCHPPRRCSPLELRNQILNAQWISFGLAAVCGREPPSTSATAAQIGSVLKDADYKALRQLVPKLQMPLLDKEGFLNREAIFVRKEDKDKDDAPLLHVELGAGSGDWILAQAQARPQDCYLAVELRADRLYQGFVKSFWHFDKDKIAPLSNVCFVGASCDALLQDGLRPQSVSTIYVNHPEPPTQTWGSDAAAMEEVVQGNRPEPAHMLTSETLKRAAQCLLPQGQGKLVIVTDNPWYARLVCWTLVKVQNRNPQLLKGLALDDARLRGVPEEFGSQNDVKLHQGLPSESIGHYATSSSSYFDRLWKTGAGKHAETKERYIVAMETTRSEAAADADTNPDAASDTTTNTATTTTTTTKKEKKKKKKKKRNAK